MNCTCIEDTERKIIEFLTPKVKGPIESVKCENIVFTFPKSGDVGTLLDIPFMVKADAPGYRSSKGKRMAVVATYCPFCGKKTKPDAQEQGESDD